MRRSATVAAMFATVIVAQDNGLSKLGTIDCGPHYTESYSKDSCHAISCQSDAECQLPKDAPIGGLPYICLTDVKFCGWQDLSKQKNKGK